MCHSGYVYCSLKKNVKDVIGVDEAGGVLLWQQDYDRLELEFDLEVSFTSRLFK